MRNLKKIILFLGAVSLVAFGATNFKKTEKKVKAENGTTTTVITNTKEKKKE